MIQDADRSYWIGASDSAMVMGDWGTKAFGHWWMIKLGLAKDDYSNARMRAGTAYEHRILEHMGVKRMDRQIRCARLRLRVNLDGEDRRRIHEVKTYSRAAFSVTPAYWMQCQVEMFATSLNGRKRKECEINAYRMHPEDYLNYLNPIDQSRLSSHPVIYNPAWAETAYLPRLRYLAECLHTGECPNILAVDGRHR